MGGAFDQVSGPLGPAGLLLTRLHGQSRCDDGLAAYTRSVARVSHSATPATTKRR